MGIEHKSLVDGRWQNFTLYEQMANIGSEVERALNWRAKGNPAYSERAYHRALELCDFTLADLKNLPRAKELARGREALVDYFQGSNEYGSSDKLLRQYYFAFAYAARRNR